MFKLFCIDERKETLNTMSKLHRNTNKSNLSQIYNSAEFHSIKVFL